MLISRLRQAYAKHYEWALAFPVVRRIRAEEARLIRQVFASELAAGQSVLEVGAGTGYYTLEIAPRVARVVALEKSPEMAAELARRIARAGTANASVVQSDFFAYRPEGPFDHVVAIGVLDHVADWAGFLARCAGLAKRRVIVTMPHRGLWNRLYTPVALLSGIRVYTHSAEELRGSLDGRLLRAEDVGLRTRYSSGFTLVVVLEGGLPC
jgi:2-polyprenyl-3-methyl-5-hydroxy-6-metoxy-1,4-benzoquinol methylase